MSGDYSDSTHTHTRFVNGRDIPYPAHTLALNWVAVPKTIGAIRRKLGYAEPIPRDEALRRTVAWERDHPPATIDPAQYDYAAEDRALAAR